MLGPKYWDEAWWNACWDVYLNGIPFTGTHFEGSYWDWDGLYSAMYEGTDE